MLGTPEKIVTIHGGTKEKTEEELKALFASDRDVQLLIATDAAGEGINLQRANLMVNYDLPWNPNRIEQRFECKLDRPKSVTSGTTWSPTKLH